MTRLIKSIKVLKGGLTIEYKEQDDNAPVHIKADYDVQPSESFFDALSKLIPHFLLITENSQDTLDRLNESIEEGFINNYTVYGFAINGEGNAESVILKGKKKLSSGKFYPIVAPKIFLRSTSDTPYDYEDELNTALDMLIVEVDKFMEGKFETSNQMSLPFDAPSDEEEEEENK